MKAEQKCTHRKRKQCGNRDRRNRMRIKHFKQFNVRRNQRNQVALIAPLKFCRTQFPQDLKNFVADDGKKLKRNIVIERLFDVMQNTAQQSQNGCRNKNRLEGKRKVRLFDGKKRITAERGNCKRA